MWDVATAPVPVLLLEAVAELHGHRVALPRVGAQGQPPTAARDAQERAEANGPLGLVYEEVRRLVESAQPQPQPHSAVVGRGTRVALPNFGVARLFD